MKTYLIGVFLAIALGMRLSVPRAAAQADLESGGLRFARVGDLPAACLDGCSLHMINVESGWLYSRWALWLTKDGGATWEGRNLPPIRPGDSIDVHMLDEKNGWGFEASQRLYATTDGGRVWQPQRLPQTDGVIETAWVLPGSDVAWLGGEAYQAAGSPDAPNYALKKYDSGTWGILAPAVYARHSANGEWSEHMLPPGSFTILKLAFLDEKTGFALGDTCSYYTDTAGAGWIRSVLHAGGETRAGFASPDGRGANAVYFLDRTHGWLSVREGFLYQTRDAGRNWVQTQAPGAPHFDDLRFLTPSKGFGVAHGSDLYETSDGVASWKPVKLPMIIRSISALDKTHAWVLSDSALYRLSVN